MNTGFLNHKRIVLILVAVLLTYGAPSISAEVVSIPDPNLRAAIEKALGKTSGATINADEMTTLTQLHTMEANISDLAGLEHAINLKILDLQNNSISDISPLAGLTKLTYLNLYNNSISDISPVAGLTNLTTLWLPNNSISDISPVAGLANLTRLGLSNISISDISPVAGLTNLTTLWLYNNSISDISPLAGLTKLTYLNLYNNSISDISPVAGLTNLTTLWLYNNSISDLSPLAGLTNLTHLGLYNNSISDLSPLAELTNLKELNLGRNTITDFSPLAGLTNLTTLWLSNSSISDLSPLVSNTGLGPGDTVYVLRNPLSPVSINTHIPTLQGRGVDVHFDAPAPVNIPDPNLRAAIEKALGKAAGAAITPADMATLTGLEARSAGIIDLTGLEWATNLTSLDLYWNSVSDISVLSGLTRLEELDLFNSSVSDISALSGLTLLEELNLGNNAVSDISVSDISALSGLTNLKSLWLTSNSISDISALSGLSTLTLLYLNFNAISDISSLSGLTNLTLLHLEGNNISNLSPLVSNTGLGTKDIVDVRENPLSTASINTHIPILQGRGVTVEFDGATVQAVNIPDPNLRAAVEAALGKASGDTITTADMATLIELDARQANISDLTGLEWAINLTSLGLWANNVSDISAVAGLTNLTKLNISTNSISDISPLAGLTNLTQLSLYQNNISDISAVAGLTNLTWLNLSINSLSNISAVAGLTNLTGLDVHNNNISDISALSGLTNLTYLWLEDTSVSDISLLARLTNLTKLGLGGTSLSDVSLLAGLTNLIWLYLEDNNISDISALSGLINLIRLDLEDNNISDISALVSNTGLGSGDWVDVRSNPLNAISLNTHLPTLQGRGVSVEFDAVSAVTIPDPNLRAAIEKALGKASGATITPADMATLTQFFARGNNISNLTGLEHAINLTKLYLDTNNISDLSPLAGLTKLTWLELLQNRISDSDLSPLSSLTNLTGLGLNTNNISDISSLLSNTGLGTGDTVDVRWNPLNAAAYNTHIPALQRRGVQVQFNAPAPVNIPDPNFRAAVEAALGKASGDTITTADMANLTNLRAREANIINLTGLEHAINLTFLDLYNNSISDISPLTGLTKLTTLYLFDNNISDISALSGLTNLTSLVLGHNRVSEISALSGLTNPTFLDLDNNSISDLSPLVSNTGLGTGDTVYARSNPLSPVSLQTHILTLQSIGVRIYFDAPAAQPVNIPDPNLRAAIGQALGKASGATITTADMTTLTQLRADNANISDLTGLAYAANNLTFLNLDNNNISDLTSLISNTGLGGTGSTVYIRGNPLSAVSHQTHIPILQARGVRVYFDAVSAVNIPDPNLRAKVEAALGKASGDTITPAEMATLTKLKASQANISDLTGLEWATNLTVLYLGWNSISDISVLSNLTNLATLELWYNRISDISALAGLTKLTTLNLYNNHNLSDISAVSGLTNLTSLVLHRNSISDISALAGLTNLTTLDLEHNSISDLSPLVSNRGLGTGDTVNVRVNPLNAAAFNTHIPTLQGRGVTVYFDATTTPETPLQTTVRLSPASVASPGMGEQLSLSLEIEDAQNVTGYEANVEFDDTALRYISGENGDFLPAGGFFVEPVVEGNLITLNAASLAGESSGGGVIATLTFEVIAAKPSTLTLSDVLLINSAGEVLAPLIENAEITEPARLKADVDGDGIVNVQDLVLVASNFGKTGENDADVNDDGLVNIQDLILVAGAIGTSNAAPALNVQALSMLTASDVKGWLTQAQQLTLTDATSLRGIQFLEHSLATLTPKQTKLLANFPNPFNPETWIPYHLAKNADVTLQIYALNGVLVRTLALGHQQAGFYTDRTKAAYWDGRNAVGERVASGAYFYQLQAGDYTAIRKMLILK